MTVNTNAFVLLNGDQAVSLDFKAQQVQVFNPTRGFIYINPGDGTIPTANTAKIKIPPQSERQLPLDNVQQFGVSVQLPNPANPATAIFRAVPQPGAIGGLTFNTPIDSPVALDVFAPLVFVSKTYKIPVMVGRWLRLHWSATYGVGNTQDLLISVTDGAVIYQFRVLHNPLGLGAITNFSDFGLDTNKPITILVRPLGATDTWGLTLSYEFLDRAEYPFPQAHQTATRGFFYQFPASGIGFTQSIPLFSGFHSFAIGLHVRGNGALCKNFQFNLADGNNNVPYFELQPQNYGPATSPVNPGYAIILPGDVQNFPAGGSAGQTLPVGSVSAFTVAGPQFDYQLSRSLNIDVYAGSVLSFTPLDTAILFANAFIEFTEPF